MEREYSSANNKAILSSVQNICRICLSKYDTMISLLSTKENALLLDMFTSVTSIKVQSKDGLPLQICELCETEVVNCYQFKIKCKKSNSILKSLIKTQNKTGINTNVSLKNTSEPIQDYSDLQEIKESDLEYIEESKISQEELSNVEIDSEIKPDNAEVTEVEYLEDGIFECNEVEIQKQIINQSLTITETENGLLQNSLTGLTEKSISVQRSQKKDKRKYYSCSFCSKKFLKTRTLKVHVKQNHGKVRQPYSCGQCKDSFSSEQDLHIHSALHAKSNAWICNQCHKEFKERGKLRRHIRRHMASKRHACELCGKQFAERCALRRHARVHTGQAPEKRHACHMCDKKYSESAALAAHVLRHAGLRPCTCDTCGKAFPSPRLLASHRRVHSDRKPHACRYCDKRFRHESTRNTHHRTHTGEKPYVCSACGKSFIQNSNLTLHMRTHTGEKPYSCDVCERKFSSGSALASHRRTHTGEKPYGCPVCGKRFARVYLSSHMRQHTGERPFACCVCTKRFANAARLRQHHLIHTGEKPFECAICSQKFKTKGYLAKHLKNHEMINDLEKRKILVLQEVEEFRSYVRQAGEVVNEESGAAATETAQEEPAKSNVTVEVTEETPFQVSEEVILPNNGDVKTELVVIDREGICLRTSGNYDNNQRNYNDVNLVTVNEGEVNISASSMLEGTTVKLYQLDQSLVQIHTSGGQVTISKITSKMTANF